MHDQQSGCGLKSQFPAEVVRDGYSLHGDPQIWPANVAMLDQFYDHGSTVAVGTVMAAIRASATVFIPSTWPCEFTSAPPDWPGYSVISGRTSWSISPPLH